MAWPTLTVFVSSTSDDLAAHRKAAQEVVLGLRWHPVLLPEHEGAAAGDVLDRCRREVRGCDLVVLLQAFRRGSVPPPERGGDGEASFTAWELRAAATEEIPVLAFLADEARWPGSLWENDDQAARDWVRAFRQEKVRDQGFVDQFPDEPEPLETFRARLEKALVRHAARLLEASAAEAPSSAWAGVDLLPEWREPELPDRPYPLLEPYTHPRLFAGREAEVETLAGMLRRDRLILGLHAPSGSGKSSLLAAGLEPRLRREGVPVARVRHPAEPRLAWRLVGRLLDLSVGAEVADDESQRFAEWVRHAGRLAGRPPVLVLDQFEDCLRSGDGDGPGRPALARLGPLLAATAPFRSGAGEPACRWVLAYREEAHGEVERWLQDVLGEARRAGREGLGELASDLSGADRFGSWALPAFGAGGDAAGAFRAAIEAPLRLRGAAGERAFDVRFAEGGVARLAAAFAAARERQPEVPLLPELQVVLSHLMADARGGEIEVPEAVQERIDRALAEHLRRALDDCFPVAADEGARLRRSRALLALRRLADAQGRRAVEGVPRAQLVAGLGAGGEAVVERLASPEMRLVVTGGGPEGAVYSLSHDRLAALVGELLEDEALQRELELDEETLRLERFVDGRAALWEGLGDRGALEVGRETLAAIDAVQEALISDERRRAWWTAARQAGRRRGLEERLGAALVGGRPGEVFVALLGWISGGGAGGFRQDGKGAGRWVSGGSDAGGGRGPGRERLGVVSGSVRGVSDRRGQRAAGTRARSVAGGSGRFLHPRPREPARVLPRPRPPRAPARLHRVSGVVVVVGRTALSSAL